MRRSGGGPGGRRISSAKEGRAGRGGGSGITGSGLIEIAAGRFWLAPGGVRQRRNPRRRLGGAGRALRNLVARRHGAHDVGLDDDVAGAADHQEVLDIVAADQHEAAAAIDRGGVDHGEARHPPARGVGAEPAVGESPDQPCGKTDQRQDDDEREEEHER